jgi:acetylornithine deacetylase/succinyl-diaminopimelate desuccinylase-like protein
MLVLETDEEIGDNDGLGIQWLVKNHHDLIDAEYALNEGGGVGIRNGKLIRNSLQTMEKVYLNYRLEVLNKGGHSSVPSTDNAIYHLAAGLARLGKFSFSDDAGQFRAHSRLRKSANRGRHRLGLVRVP